MKSVLNKPLQYESYYQFLIQNKLFDTLKDVFMLCATLGYEEKQRIPFSKSGGDGIKEHIFSDEDKNLMDIIAIMTTGDVKILLDERRDEKYTMIEEFAHGGIKVLVENIFDGPITTEEKLMDFVLKYAPNGEGRNVDLTDVIDDLINSL